MERARRRRLVGAVVMICVVSLSSVACRDPGFEGTITTVPDVELDCGDDREAGTAADHRSQSISVLFQADVEEGGPTWDDITAEVTMTYLDGTLTPTHLSVEAGTMIGIAIPDEGRQGDVAIGCSNGRLTLRGSTTGFMIADPGTYPVIDELRDATIGTITAT